MFNILIPLLICGASATCSEKGDCSVSITFSGYVVSHITTSINMVPLSEDVKGVYEMFVSYETNMDQYKRIENKYLVLDDFGALENVSLMVYFKDDSILFKTPTPYVYVMNFPKVDKNILIAAFIKSRKSGYNLLAWLSKNKEN